ncbi:hypothetical protein J2S09_004458 [Bacillus fengqiuensis]|nr:hypothetical protein [Bacillus fengqiuensis]
MTMKDQLNKIIKEKIAPLMKQEGFKKSANNFYHELPELGWCMQLELNRWNTVEEVEFRLNTGIYIPKVYELIDRKPSPKFPKEIDSIARRTVAELKGIKTDFWYRLDRHKNIDSLIQQVQTDIEDVALPHFKQYYTLHDVVEGITQKQISPGSMLALGIVLAMDGQLEKATNIFRKDYKLSYGVQKAMVRRITQEFDIELE